MKQFIRHLALISLCVVSCAAIPAAASADDSDTRQARSYISDAEYQMRRAESYRRDAEYYRRQAESHQRDAAYYTRRGDSSRAKDYLRRAEQAMDTYNSKIRSARNADSNASDYLRRASEKLRYAK